MKVHTGTTNHSPCQSAALRTLQLPDSEEALMATCDVCGNEYGKSFTVTQGSRTGTFDSFECAIQAFAPRCAHCDCTVIGHGVETADGIYCCAHCARHVGMHGSVDRG
jgi:hypothetical protein